MILKFLFHRWLQCLGRQRRKMICRRPPLGLLGIQTLEVRTLLSVSVLNNAGQGFNGLSFNESGGYVPPDTNGAAGPSAYVETVNQEVALYGSKGTGANAVTDSLSHFLFTTGGLTRADSSSGLSDPVICYDEQIGRFVVGDQDVNFNSHVSSFDMAVSKSSNPTSLSASDWTFYKIDTTESGFDADYPGNFGYNHDALVFTLNMFAVAGTGHVQVVAVNAADLSNAVASPQVAKNDLNDFSVRPTTMHDSVAGDPMWLVTEHGDNTSIDVIKMSGVLTNTATFTYTNLSVAPYSATVNPRNPNGSVITDNIDSRITKAAEANNTIVAAQSVSISSNQDVVQWYAINVSSGTPTLAQQGRVSAGPRTYLVFPGIDVNAAGQIGMSYMQSGNDTSTDFLSMRVTGRVATDAAGTMETSVTVPAGQGLANYRDFTSGGRAGDLSGINVDPVDGTFWAANEFANTESSANWGTAIADFASGTSLNSADLAVTNTGPASVPAGTTATYTITLVNNGPNAATGVVLSDALPAGSTLVSMSKILGNDSFTLVQSGGTITETATNNMASESSDTFSLVVSAPGTLSTGSNFSNQASVTSTSSDSNSVNNSATAAGSIAGPIADLAVTNVPGATTASEGDKITYTITVKNNGPNPGTGVVPTDVLGANLKYVSATTSTGTLTRSRSVVTFNLRTLAVGGLATLKITAQATEEGTLTETASVTATSSDTVTTNNSASAGTTVAEPAIVVSGPMTTTQRNPNNLRVATFTHAGGVEPASDFTATIDWGDGTTSTGTIALSGTTYTVTGSHRYSSGGSHTIKTTVSEIGNSTLLLLGKIGDEIPGLPDHRAPRIRRR